MKLTGPSRVRLMTSALSASWTSASTRLGLLPQTVEALTPAGYRYIKHILLDVDETLKSRYTDLAARLEEQMDAEAEAAAATEAPAATDAAAATVAPTDTPDPAITPEPTQEPVTQADVDSAKADILASVQATIDAINQKIAEIFYEAVN